MSKNRPILIEGDILDDDFEVGRLIGDGGFGQVYEAFQLSLGRRKVAIKVEEYNPYWQNDARVLASISSKYYLPEVYRKFEIRTGGTRFVCLVMQFINGESLESIVKHLPEDEYIDVDRAVKWLVHICYALEELHGKNIIHTDVKPANIMIEDNDDACLIDFNAAVINKRVNSAGLCVSKGYSPPEQYSKALSVANSRAESGFEMFGATQTNNEHRYIPGVADERNDIYSAGALLYFLLFKRRPPSSEGRTSKKFITEQSGLIKDHAPLYKVIEKATALKPEERYKSAAEFRFALEKALRQVRRGVKKLRTVAIACAFAVVMVVLGLTAGAVILIRNNQVREAGAFGVFEKGRALTEKGDFEGAKRLFDENIAEYDDYIFLYALWAEALCGNSEYERYLTEYESFPDKVKNYKGKYLDFYAQILFYTGEANYCIGNYTLAAEFYMKAISSDSEQINYKLAYMRTLAFLGEADKLAKVKLELPSNALDNDWLHFYEGIALKAQNDFAAAEENFLLALKSNDEQLLWAVVYECSTMYTERNEHEKQIVLLADKRYLFTVTGRSIIVNERLGESLWQTGKFSEALECFEYLAEIQTYSYRAHEILATAQVEMKLYDDAKITLEKMIGLSPKNIRGYMIYIGALMRIEEGKAYAERDYTDAYKMFLIAEEIDNKDADVIIYRDVFKNLILNGIITE